MKHRRGSPCAFSAMLTLLLVAACTQTRPRSESGTLLGKLDLSTFAQIPAMQEIDSGGILLNLQPAAEYDYWELRGVNVGRPTVLARGGRISKEALPPPNGTEIDAIGTAEGGFGRGCPPAWCFKYLVAVRSNQVEAVRHPADLGAFLGEIDTRDEAILFAEASGYHWGASKEEAAIRDMADGYELLVLRYVDSTERCQHGGYRADLYRVLLHLSRSGTATEKVRQFLERGNCGIP